ncbi:hypothetical protein H7U19_05590 [Hyunsoonleella sp. SJ7]|uniref:Uncharacterized protein n=1 Tax=Hyunsoonleella aquatilis TaxID=2762758 RepID=A0A923KKI5_9FLAO|nr:hypothetical protein [Hyunsoonleella aquatilis]MBC3757868.1 hypothetical protein [Hyunsoonleella aquatilis]
MSNFRLNLPIDIPWQFISSSVHPLFRKPPCSEIVEKWKPTIEVYAYEPPFDENIESNPCAKQTVYLKIVCSITGFQHTVNPNYFINYLEHLENIEINEIISILQEYYSCYGVLLDVRVFENNDKSGTPDCVIQDFEPKRRDYYQSVVETGEILSSSIGTVGVGKGQKNLKSTESKVNVTGTAGGTGEVNSTGAGSGESGTSLNASGGFGGTAKGGITHTRSQEDNYNINTDVSTERRELESHTTYISQLYNYLSSYRLGRGFLRFFMLPRPHTMQTTPFRSFAQGLRQIEGIQEFFLVAERNKDSKGLLVDVNLNTAHYPEGVEFSVPKTNYEYDFKKITLEFPEVISKKTGTGWFRSDKEEHKDSEELFIDDGWEIDHEWGLEEEILSGDNADDSIFIANWIESTSGFGDNRKAPAIEEHAPFTIRENLITYDFTLHSEAAKISGLSATVLRRTLDIAIGLATRGVATVLNFLRSHFDDLDVRDKENPPKTKFHRKYKYRLRRPKESNLEPSVTLDQAIINRTSICNSYENNNGCLKSDFGKLDIINSPDNIPGLIEDLWGDEFTDNPELPYIEAIPSDNSIAKVYEKHSKILKKQGISKQKFMTSIKESLNKNVSSIIGEQPIKIRKSSYKKLLQGSASQSINDFRQSLFNGMRSLSQKKKPMDFQHTKFFKKRFERIVGSDKFNNQAIKKLIKNKS